MNTPEARFRWLVTNCFFLLFCGFELPFKLLSGDADVFHLLCVYNRK